jgi:hypothetical protein
MIPDAVISTQPNRAGQFLSIHAREGGNWKDSEVLGL